MIRVLQSFMTGPLSSRFAASATLPPGFLSIMVFSPPDDGPGPIPPGPPIELTSDTFLMEQALRQARRAFQAGEVPVGAVIVQGGTIIARAHNQVETLRDATAHAEMLALSQAQEALGDWRLTDCDLYVTKEPCPMCAGAIVHCRPERVVFGCPDPKAGAAGGWINLLDANPPLNHRCEVVSGVLGEESLALIQGFFREARERKKAGEDKPRPGS
jgi:tRNA(adenine34) deaminase